MKHALILIVFLILSFVSPLSLTATELPERKFFELSKVEVLSIQDSQHNRQYELYVKLPDNYDANSDKKHPVIYFTDAVWHVEILSSATEFLLTDTILVGISWQKDIAEQLKADAGEWVSRHRDYSIRQSDDPKIQAKYNPGQAADHLRFIREDVIKYVESHYSVSPSERTYFGYSAGGLFGAYVLQTHPATFKNYILGSPSLKRNLSVLSQLESTKDATRKGPKINVFLSYGTEEQELSTLIETFSALLKEDNAKNAAVTLREIQGDHGTAFPMTAVGSITWLSELSKKLD